MEEFHSDFVSKTLNQKKRVTRNLIFSEKNKGNFNMLVAGKILTISP